LKIGTSLNKMAVITWPEVEVVQNQQFIPTNIAIRFGTPEQRVKAVNFDVCE